MKFKDRAGVYVKTMEGVNAFIPKPLPPDPGIKIDMEMMNLISLAERKLGSLSAITPKLPNPEMFVAMYVNKEALLSSQIEGTQASFIDVLEASRKKEDRGGILEVINYVNALNFGLERLDTLPLSLRLIKEIHSLLLQTGRGSVQAPGEFRRTQNWIGAPGSTLNTAAYIPPSVPEMEKAMSDLEKYFYKKSELPQLIKIALIHAQFETIHPFVDGNGRMGRLLITFWLCQQEILTKPLLYLSYYFKMKRDEYYDKLTRIRTEGDWEGWIKFFLDGVACVAEEAMSSANEIIDLLENIAETLTEKYPSNNNYQRLLNTLFEMPLITKKDVKEALDVSYPTASMLVETFEDLGYLSDTTPNQNRNKVYLFRDYINIIERGTEL